MFYATLIANPKTATLDVSLVEALRNAWGGTEARWLSQNEAAEFHMPARPDTVESVWKDLQDQKIDLIVQPSKGRRKALLIADMDSTMIEQECIDELAAEAGFGPKVAAITARAMNGELDFEAALDTRVALLKGLPVSIIEKVIAERISFMPGGQALVQTMKKNGAYTALVSGGFTDFTARVGNALGFDENRANVLLTDADRLTGTVARPILGQEAKVKALEEITACLGISEEDALAVGDGANDLAMLTRAGTGVALHAKPSVQQAARHRINHGDLTALLYLQGYARDDFAC